MYAAAGGASIASRKARQTKQKKTQEAQEKLAKAKSGLVTTARPKLSRQFHQLPPNYYARPHGLTGRKLSSASFATQSRLLLPIHEGNGHHHSHSHHAHSHFRGQQHLSAHPHGERPSTPRLLHPDDEERALIHHHSQLIKSATANLPLVSQVDATPPNTPPYEDGKKLSVYHRPYFELGPPEDEERVPLTKDTLQSLPIPHDAIIVTPATPIASPGHSTKGGATSTSSQALAAAEEQDFFGPGPLERKCSFQRLRKKSDAFDYQFASSDIPAMTTVISPETMMPVTGPDHPYYPPGLELTQAQLCHYRDYTDDGSSNLANQTKLLNGGSSTSVKWTQCAYCEEGICTCDHIECAQGRAAWLERERIRRCSIQDKESAATCHRRWVKRNRIQDASLGGSSSDDEDILGALRGPSNFANAFLYVGLGTVAIGLVIAFVGTGEKGFKTVELRLIGPALIGIGLICCILRICFCICPSHCISKSRRARKKNSNKVDADHTTSLLRGEAKRVQIAKGSSTHKFPLSRKKSNNKMLNEGMEALRQIATTSLFLQNEQKPPTSSSSTNRIVPIIKEPLKSNESELEMRKLDTTLNISDITDDEEEDDEILITTTIPNSSQTVTKEAPAATSINSSIHQKSSSNLDKNNETIDNKIIKKGDDPDVKLFRTESKLGRKRVAINQKPAQSSSAQISKNDTEKNSDTLLMETSLTDTTTSTHPSTTTTSVGRGVMSSLSVAPSLTTFISPSGQYDLPSTKPHQTFSKLDLQHQPGQIMDTSTSSDSLASQLILTPSLLSSSSIYLQHQNTTSSSSSSLMTVVGATTTGSGLIPVNEASELVLSPAKLGQ